MAEAEIVQVGTLLKTAAAQLRSVTEDRDAVVAELAGVRKKERAEKVASEMVDRGIISKDDVIEKVAELQERDDLNVVEEALKISSHEDLAKVATVGEAPSGAGLHPFEAFILSHQG